MGLKLNGRYISLILAVQIGKWTAGRAGGGRRAAGPEAPGGTDWPAVARGCGEAGKPPGMGAWLLGTGASRVGFAKKREETPNVRQEVCAAGCFLEGLSSLFTKRTSVFASFSWVLQVWCALGKCTAPCHAARLYFEGSKGECRNKMAR